MQNTGIHTDGVEEMSFETILWHLPLNDMQELAGRHAQFYQNWLEHPSYDDYWKDMSVEERFESIGIPVHTFGGWYDILAQGTLNGYMGMSKKGKTAIAREKSRMIVGPWGHRATRKYGDIDFGEHAMVDTQAVELRWYDYWLKGIDDGSQNEPPVKIFVMGKNQWRSENEFPLARAQYRKLYLHSGGNANSSRGDGRLSWDAPSAQSRPDRTASIRTPGSRLVGGANCCGAPTPAGPVDQRPVESRHDVLVYTSDYLNMRKLEVTGPLKLVHPPHRTLGTRASSPNSSDVYPDGRAINPVEGIVRARYRESLSTPKLMEPGKTYAFEINMLATSNVFFERAPHSGRHHQQPLPAI